MINQKVIEIIDRNIDSLSVDLRSIDIELVRCNKNFGQKAVSAMLAYEGKRRFIDIPFDIAFSKVALINFIMGEVKK